MLSFNLISKKTFHGVGLSPGWIFWEADKAVTSRPLFRDTVEPSFESFALNFCIVLLNSQKGAPKYRSGDVLGSFLRVCLRPLNSNIHL